jgi:hypothetical protein
MADAADIGHRFPNVCDVDFFWELRAAGCDEGFGCERFVMVDARPLIGVAAETRGDRDPASWFFAFRFAARDLLSASFSDASAADVNGSRTRLPCSS